MWRTRPARVPSKQGSGAWLAGICEGIGVRYQISPAIVRVAFVLLTFASGMGIMAYAALALIMPRYTVDRTPLETLGQRWNDKRYKSDRIVAIVALIVLLLTVPGSTIATVVPTLGTILAIALPFLAAWLLHQRTPEPVNDCYATAYRNGVFGPDYGLSLIHI